MIRTALGGIDWSGWVQRTCGYLRGSSTSTPTPDEAVLRNRCNLMVSIGSAFTRSSSRLISYRPGPFRTRHIGCRSRNSKEGSRLLPSTTRQQQRLSRYPARIVRSKKHRGRRNVRGCAIRPSGVVASVCLRKSLSAKPTECSPSVSTMPGFIEFTRIFFGPSSPASETVIASTAAFVALYTEAIGTGIGPTIELTLMIEPPSARSTSRPPASSAADRAH